MSFVLSGRPVFHFKEISSTNDYAMNLINSGFPVEGTVVRADFQTAGKGQMNKSWHSKSGENLLISIILQPSFLRIDNQFRLHQFVSISIVRSLGSFIREKAYIKWPNDILVGGKKLCGILIQNVLQGSQIKYSIIGIGMNVNQCDFPPDTLNPCSIRSLNGFPSNIDEVFAELISQLEYTYTELYNSPQTLQTLYSEFFFLKDQSARFLVGKEVIEGIIRGTDKNGMLLLENQSKILKFSHGQIQFIQN